MANKFATNFAIPSSSNCFQVIWKLTRTMKAAGWTVVAHSDGTTKTSAGTNNNDSWGSNADPTADTYPSFDAAAPWIVLKGPSTLKIPISGAPTGTPVRGETITQTATSFEGELLGFVWDSVGGSGHMVVMPRVNSPNTSTNLVGSSSSSAFTPTGTIVTYQREVVFAKASSGSTNQGDIYYVCADVSGESASLYSQLATQTGCTATVPPGGGGTNNGFPSIGITVRGTGGSASSVAPWLGSITSTFGTSAQIGCANATPATTITADGSFYISASTTTTAQMTGFQFTRIDDQEPGDVDPYIWITTQSNDFTNWSRTSFVGTANASYTWSLNNINAIGAPTLVGYQARGITTSSRDVVAPYAVGAGATTLTGIYIQTIASVGTVKILNTPATATPIPRELVLVFTTGQTPGTSKQIKGRCRWLAYLSVGSSLDTYDSKTWFCTASVASSSPAIAIGPYDGSTTPIS